MVLSVSEEFVRKFGDEPWSCRKEDEGYYRQTKAPNDELSVISSVFLIPFLEFVGIRKPPQDPTYGRYTLPFSPREKTLRGNPQYTCWDARVFLNENRQAVEEKTDRWIWYQVWWDEGAAKKNGNTTDLCYCHGISDYGGKFSAHAQRFLEAGYRLIVPDHPTHGRSTGLHSHLNNLNDLAHAVHVVLVDVIKRDEVAGRAQRSVVVSGQSMGGFTAVLYGLLYHTPSVPGAVISSDEHSPNILGLLLLCPMLAISPETQPPALIATLAPLLDMIAGRYGIVPGYKGNASEDPWTDVEFNSDPQTYHGDVRCSTGLAILQGITFVNKHMGEITLPFLVMHGECDRVTATLGSKLFFEEAISTDKEIKIYPRTEHVMLRVGRDGLDDQKRQHIISDMLVWMERICRVRD